MIRITPHANTPQTPAGPSPANTAQSTSLLSVETPRFSFFQADGTRLVDDQGESTRLRGVAFGNQVWGNARIPVTHHDENDFTRIHALGMNLVRFYINYRTLESETAPFTYLEDGWAWIDRNISWARAHGVYLILNMHVPPGGLQSHGEGASLWRERPLQQRLIGLWRAIAARYAEEPVILGYDLLNEPGVTENRRQWQSLAQEISGAIRSVDSRHVIFVERVNSVAGSWTNDHAQNFVRIEDSNVAYTFHFYEPFLYTHQGAPWSEVARKHDGRWPDPARGHDRDYLAKKLVDIFAWGEREDVPLYLGEFGCIRQCCENHRGGLAWIGDVIDLVHARGTPYTFHAYHEDFFGLYLGDGPVDPAHANQSLIDLLSKKLRS